ncbi:MAG TPA: hypothetical protein VMW53_01125 [archaeon]|nr:hypothetical protein [archaeon]
MIKHCPLCNKEYLEDTTLIEYSENGKYYYDMRYGNWCLPGDMRERTVHETNGDL